jgi:tripartite-type tricarboxylate transporter receptor subunit TctC
MRGRLLCAVVALAMIAWTGGAAAFPERQIRLIVPYGPGGITDITARIIAPRLGEELGVQVIVDNRPGGAAMLGFGMTARAPADGHTIVLATTALAANPVLFRNIPYDARTDFAPVGMVGVVPMLLVVPVSSPVTTLQEFVALVRARGGEHQFGTAGNGSGNHLATELFLHSAGLRAVHVPYRGGGQVMTDLVAGHVGFVFAVLPTARPFVLEGRLRGIAVTGLRRSAALPDVPTVSETLLPGFAVHEWLGLFGPAGMPAAVVARLNAALQATLTHRDTAERLAGIGVETAGGTPAALGAHLAAELDRWADLARHVRFEVAE